MAELIVPYDAKPDYDDWGPDGFWDLATWVGWHKGLVKKYGRNKDASGYPIADKIWLDAWTKQSMGASPTLAILQPSRFKDETDYIKKFPLLYQYTNLKKAVEQFNPLETSYSGVNAAENLVGGASGVVSGIGSGLNVLKYVIPVAVVLMIGTGIYITYNKVSS